jgi:outer membrane biosynthesis protein TonB
MRRSPFFILTVLTVLASVQPKVSFAQDQQGASASGRKVINRVVPTYPQMAHSINLSGIVKLEVLVQSNGSVKSMQVKGGSPVFSQSAQFAVHGWKWEKADHDTMELVEVHFNP